MSVTIGKKILSSILKTYKSTKPKNAIIKKVRFDLPKPKGIADVVSEVYDHNNYRPMHKYVHLLTEATLSDDEFIEVVEEARKLVYQLNEDLKSLVKTLIELPWLRRCPEAVDAYTNFFIEIMSTHNCYVNFGITKLIGHWIPVDNEADSWSHGTPVPQKHIELQNMHKLLDSIVNVIPMTFDVIVEKTRLMFPYFKKPTHVVAGFVYNLLWLVKYKPIFVDHVFELVLKKMILLDVFAPRKAIEELDDEDEDEEDNLMAVKCESEEQLSEKDCFEAGNAKDAPMTHPIANTLDICLEKLYSFIESICLSHQKSAVASQTNATVFFKLLLDKFDSIVLTCHDSHHVQFLIFYYCSFKTEYVEMFLAFLWDKVKDPNVYAFIRQAAACYIGSFLARSRSVTIDTLKQHLKEMCNWAHKYVQQADHEYGSLKTHLAFYNICQSVFYVIAFRGRDLTKDERSLRFLESLHLADLVKCHLNPLRVCRQDVATIFAEVTRTYQIVYCHAIMASNARRKLATVNAHGMCEETLEMLFPFDPYRLKLTRYRCRVCTKAHPLRLCAQFLNLSVESRRRLVRTHNYCVNCLAQSHHIRECTSSSTCTLCQRKHNTLLHPSTRQRLQHAREPRKPTQRNKVRENHRAAPSRQLTTHMDATRSEDERANGSPSAQAHYLSAAIESLKRLQQCFEVAPVQGGRHGYTKKAKRD